jgi:hypothetical protein
MQSFMSHGYGFWPSLGQASSYRVARPWTAKQLPHHVLRRDRTYFIQLDQVRASVDHSCMALSAGTRASDGRNAAWKESTAR